jgi:hypothetical protein
LATQLQVQCINKSRRSDAHERILNIGGGNPGGGRWKLAEPQAIKAIKEGRTAFYVERPPGRRVKVIIATHRGREYLKTQADGLKPDNLLSLPECPP